MAIDLEREVKDLKRRVDLAETRLSNLKASSDSSPGNADIQLYLHTRFDDIDRKIDGANDRIDGLRTKSPHIVASAVGPVMREHGSG
jgi:hypothetical protein